MFEYSSQVENDGTSKAAHLRQAAASAAAYGVALPKEIEESSAGATQPPPPGFELIWEAFLELSNARSVGFGPCPISYSDIDAWRRLQRVPLRRWQVDLIRRLDMLWLSVYNKNAPKGDKPKKSEEESGN